MAEALTGPRIVRFGTFELDLRTGELRKAGVRLSLQEQPRQVLAMLLERPGDLITREELRGRLWPADTFVDFERGLNTAVKRLRQVLGDSADTPRFVETLPRRGYRFIAPVDGAISAAGTERRVVSEPFTAQPTHAAPRHGWRMSRLATAAAVAGAGLMATLQPFAGEPPSAPRIIPLTSLEGQEWDPALSPDGRQVAFCWDGDGLPGIYVKTVGGGDPVRVASASQAGLAVFSPTWSPSGLEVAFLRDLPADSRHEVVVVPALGGLERLLGTTTSRGQGLSWSPDGRLVAMVSKASPDEPDSIFLLEKDSGRSLRLTSPPPRDRLTGDVLPAFSPDGRSLAFVRIRGPLVFGDIFLLPLPDGHLRQLTSNELNVAGLAWTPDASSIIYAAGAQGLSSLKVVPSSGGPPAPLGLGENAGTLSTARTADRLVYMSATTDLNIWRIDGPRAGKRHPPVRITHSTRDEWSPQISPDGHRMVFLSNQTGHPSLWVCDVDGSRCSEFRTPMEAAAPRWSPDGTLIAFGGRDAKSRNTDVYVLSVASGFTKRMTDHAAGDGLPSWSRDGRWIYFMSNRSGKRQIWRMAAAGGAAIQFTQRGTNSWASADGRWLYFCDCAPAGPIWRVPAEGGEESQVLDDTVVAPNWTVWGESLLVIAEHHPGIATIERVDPETRRRVEVASVRATERFTSRGMSVSPDGRWITYTQLDHQASDLVLVEGLPRARRSPWQMLLSWKWR